MAEGAKDIRASVPQNIEADALQQLNRLGGLITSIEMKANARTAIGASLPKDRVANFKAWLSSFSNGQGEISGE